MPSLEMLCFTQIFVSSYIFLSVTQASTIGFDGSSEPHRIMWEAQGCGENISFFIFYPAITCPKKQSLW